MKAAPPTLSYGFTPVGRGLHIGMLLLIVACFIGALLCTVAIVGHLKEFNMTPQFAHYVQVEAFKRAHQPSYVSPPFVGQRLLPNHLWRYPTTYGAIVLLAAGLALCVLNYRPRHRESAG